MQHENGPQDLNLKKQQYLVAQNTTGNQLSLIDLTVQLYAKRRFIMRFTALSTLLAVIVTFLLKPEYHVQTSLTEPDTEQLQAFFENTNGTIKADYLFKNFLKTLGAKSNYIQFLEQSGLINQYIKNPEKASEKEKRTLLNNLSTNFTLTIINHNENDPRDAFKDGSLEAVLLTRSNAIDLSAKDNRAYLEFTNKEVLNQIAKAEQSRANLAIRHLEQKLRENETAITAQRKKEILQLKDKQTLTIANLKTEISALEEQDKRDTALRLEELNKALQIASTLGILNYSLPHKISNRDLLINVNSKNRDLYLRGTAYLKKEIELTKAQKASLKFQKKISALQTKLNLAIHDHKLLSLENRTNDKLYINNLESQLEEINRLKNLTFDLSSVKSFNIVGEPIVETTPMSPNKKLIILFGLLTGFIFSTLFVLAQNTFKTHLAA